MSQRLVNGASGALTGQHLIVHELRVAVSGDHLGECRNAVGMGCVGGEIGDFLGVGGQVVELYYPVTPNATLKAKVATVPGRAFFNSEARNKYVRLCFAVNDQALNQACQNISQYRGGF